MNIKTIYDKTNMFHSILKLTREYFLEKAHFFDVKVILENNKLLTELYAVEKDQ